RLQCRLVTSNIDADYEALSYTWGKPDSFDLKIWVNDCHFSVRQNLHCALKALRSTGDRYLWIDTLCINQDDSHEKGHQVGMMDLIYEKAKQVLVWLGKKNPLGFDEWGHLRPYFRRKWTPHWKQLADLFAAAYWRRLWIVQEVGLA
ncbi:heterokaryon incompatibility, partial [Stipitochalara longipes BDJ]